MRITGGKIFSAALIAAIAGLASLAGAPISVAAAPAPGWPQPRYDAAGTGYNPNETQLNAGNAGRLVTRAIVPLGRPFSASTPVVADGMVFVTGYFSTGGQPGEIEAFPQTCGAPRGLSCKPIWKAFVTYDDSLGVTVADGEVFANTLSFSAYQKLWVFGEHCGTGGAACSPLWTTRIPGHSFADQAPTVAGGTVYVPFGQIGLPNYVEAFPTVCTTGCKPLWRGQLDLGADDSAAVADGYVFIPDYDGQVYAFRVGCATGGRVCAPAWRGSVGEAGPRGVAVADGLVFIGSQNGNLYAFRARGCGTVQCSPAWTAVTRPGANIISRPAVAYGMVFVTNYGDGHLYAFPEHCAANCQPVWTAFVGTRIPYSPAVANGVVYVPAGNNRSNVGIDAFSATCATGGGICTPLWHGGGGTYYLPSPPSVADGEVWTTGGPVNGPANLYAFGLPVPGGTHAGWQAQSGGRGTGRLSPAPVIR